MGPNRPLMTSLTVLLVFVVLLVVDLFSGTAVALDAIVAVGAVIAAVSAYVFYRRDGA